MASKRLPELEWVNDRADGPDGTEYALRSESIRFEGTYWDLLARYPESNETRMEVVEDDRNNMPQTKAAKKSLARRDAARRLEECDGSRD